MGTGTNWCGLSHLQDLHISTQPFFWTGVVYRPMLPAERGFCSATLQRMIKKLGADRDDACSR